MVVTRPKGGDNDNRTWQAGLLRATRVLNIGTFFFYCPCNETRCDGINTTKTANRDMVFKMAVQDISIEYAQSISSLALEDLNLGNGYALPSLFRRM